MSDAWARPDPSEYAPFYAGYIEGLPDAPIVELLERQIAEIERWIGGLSEEDGDLRPAPDKWSVREVLGHVADTERIFGYRALRFARGDATPLPGYEQDDYVANTDWGGRTLRSLSDEFGHIRRANLVMFRGFTPQALLRGGVANGNPMTARAAAYVMAGHVRHHLRILRVE
jgi:hypothetical protein